MSLWACDPEKSCPHPCAWLGAPRAMLRPAHGAAGKGEALESKGLAKVKL